MDLCYVIVDGVKRSLPDLHVRFGPVNTSRDVRKRYCCIEDSIGKSESLKAY
jgi:hypothetical protein